MYSSEAPTSLFCTLTHRLLQIFSHIHVVHEALINFAVIFEEQWQLPTRIHLLLWILNVWISFKKQNDPLHHRMLEKLNQGQCRQEQASESLKLQWRSAPATFACRWAVRGTGVCGHRERLRLLQQVYTSERKITTSQIININEIASYFFGIKH